MKVIFGQVQSILIKLRLIRELKVVVLRRFELVGVGLEVVGLVGVHQMIFSIDLNLYKQSANQFNHLMNSPTHSIILPFIYLFIKSLTYHQILQPFFAPHLNLFPTLIYTLSFPV